jgi:membrane-bound serine protease (ClpP class)
MDSSILAFLLLAVGIALLIAEVFIPSGGVILVLASLSLLGALICAWNAWWSSQPTYFWGFLTGMVILLPIVVIVAFYIWPSTPIGKRAILEAPAPHEVEAFVEQEQRYSEMVGKVGETVTTLNPAGIARIEGQRVHCQSEGVIIDAGIKVRVIAARSNGVVVRKIDLGSPELRSPEAGPPAEVKDPGQIDFDLS